VRVEPAASPSFPARSRTTRSADPVGVAAGLADGKFDLTGEGKIARVDARSPVARAARPDAKIVSVIARHDKTIGAGSSARKSFQGLVVLWRKKTYRSVETAKPATAHFAGGTHFSIENKR
jgi:hypothetical protein